MKHKNYEIIIAYAEGRTIQLFDDGEWRDCFNPAFDSHSKYRIKPGSRWRGLTGSEVRQLRDIHIPMYSIPTTEDWFNFYRAIENELKDKNTTNQ